MSSYTPYPVPLRTPPTDAQGNLPRPWIDFFTRVSYKAGRSVTWRGEYDSAAQYAVCDVVRSGNGSLWNALQAQPVNGVAVSPGSDDTVWELVLSSGDAANGIPAGGTTGQILAKHSDTNYDAEWIDASGGGGTGALGYEFSVNGDVIDKGFQVNA